MSHPDGLEFLMSHLPFLLRWFFFESIITYGILLSILDWFLQNIMFTYVLKKVDALD